MGSVQEITLELLKDGYHLSSDLSETFFLVPCANEKSGRFMLVNPPQNMTLCQHQPKTNKWIPQNKANTQIFFFTCFTYAKLPFFEYDAIHVRCKKYSFLGLFWAPSPAEKNLAEIFWENTKPRPQNKPHWEFQQQARKSTPESYGSRVRSISTASRTKKIQPPHSQSHAGRTCLATTYRRTAVNAMVRFMRRGTGNVGWP